MALHRQGNLVAAKEIYREILRVQPTCFDALHMLGVIHNQEGRPQDSVAEIRRALELNPDSAMAHYNLGLAQQALGQFGPAEASYRQVIAIRPDHGEAHNNLGNVLQALGRLEDAEKSYRLAVRHRPANAEAHNNLGNALQSLGRFEEAVASFRRGLEIRPRYAICHFNLGNALRVLGRLEEAEASYRRAIEFQPDYHQAHNNLGITLLRLKRLEGAAASFRRVLDLRPDDAVALTNLGNVLTRLKRLEEAERHCRRATEIQPDFAEAHNDLGNVLKDLHRLEEAEASFRRALEIDPNHGNALSMAAMLQMRICDWSASAETGARLVEQVRQGRSPVAPFVFLLASDDPADQLRCAQLFAGSEYSSGAPVAARPPRTDAGRLRLGYLSADFHEHATAYLMAELFERHDRERFEVIGLSYGRDDASPMRRRLLAAFDQFHDVRLAGDREVAGLIAELGIDIVIDLKGYTLDTRIGLLADRPAPVQATYLGFPGTTGADFIDYAIVDPFVVPPDHQVYFTERLVHLPNCYQVNDGQRRAADATPTRAACGLPDEGFVFCSFNNSFKLTPAMFDIWMRLLAAVPGSVLWLLGDNPAVGGNLRREAVARGIDRDRLVFAPRVELAEHLARHRLADLFLDTLPYNAHTTASDALWMGLPVVTCAGKSFAGRVGGSLLRAVGLAELVTESPADYEALALRLARQPEALAAIAEKLASNRATAPLFDCRRFCRDLEAAYQVMWRICARGEKPRPIAID